MNEIEPASESDYSDVLKLLIDSDLIYEDLLPLDMSGFLVVRTPTDGLRVAAVAGLQTFAVGNEGLLRSVAVADSQRGKGVGAGLVTSIEQRARERGIARLWLLTTTAPAFFRRFGYSETSRATVPSALQDSTEFRDLCPASAVCMSKLL